MRNIKLRLKKFVDCLYRESSQDEKNHRSIPCKLLIGVYLAWLLPFAFFAELYLAGWNLRSWDYLLLSGVLVFAVGVILGQRLPHQMKETLDSLLNCGSLNLTRGELLERKKEIGIRANRWAAIGGALSGIAVLTTFLFAYGRESLLSERCLLTISEVIGGVIVGRVLGVAASYGYLPKLLKKTLVVQPGHTDGAAGLRPIGTLYWRQSLLVGIPAFYLGAWYLLIPLFRQQHYLQWRRWYFYLFAAVMFIEMLAFFIPLWRFHKIMQQQKERMKPKADRLSVKIEAIKQRLLENSAPEVASLLLNQVQTLTDNYQAMVRMATFPIDAKTTRRYAFQTLALMTPFFTKLAEASGLSQKAVNFAQTVISHL